MSKRSQKPPVGSSPESLDMLLAELSEHGLNFVVGQPLWQRLIARGPEVIPALLDRCDGATPFKLIDLALQKILEAADPDQRAHVAHVLTNSLGREVPPPLCQ
jgi:NAD-dependent oxidoreductase involved in siderophore biosynthesis